MTLSCRLGSLPNGKAFVTLLTRRYGTVLGIAGHNGFGGVLVGLEGPDEERILHENVLVEIQTR